MSDHTRRSVRLPGFDYASQGAYYITLVTADRACLFGRLEADELKPSALGAIVIKEWRATPIVRPGVTLGAFVAMPNHLHAVVWLPKSDVEPKTRPKGYSDRSLSSLVSGYKATVTRQHRAATRNDSAVVWQRSFYEHVIRDEDDLAAIETYIDQNPSRWADDAENRWR